MRHTNKALIFFSVFQKGLTMDINVDNTLNVTQELKDRGVDAVRYKGRYNGVDELSFCINAQDWSKVEDIVENAKQESVLFVSPDRVATLIFMGNKPKKTLGLFVKTDSTPLYDGSDYSYNPYNKTFFTIKEL